MLKDQLDGRTIRFATYNMLQSPTREHARQVAEHINAHGPFHGIALQELADPDLLLSEFEKLGMPMHIEHQPIASLTPRGRGAHINNGISILSPYPFVPGSRRVIRNPDNEVGFKRSPLGLLYKAPSSVNRAILSAEIGGPEGVNLRIASGHSAINTAAPTHRLREDRRFANGLQQQQLEGTGIHLLGRDRNAGDGSVFVRRTSRLLTSAGRVSDQHKVATYHPTSPLLHDRIGLPMDGISFDENVLDLVGYKVVGHNSGEPEGPSDHLLVIAEFIRKNAA